MATASCRRDAAAVELGTPIEINYTYGGQFFGDANITAKMEGWYTTGTEIRLRLRRRHLHLRGGSGAEEQGVCGRR